MAWISTQLVRNIFAKMVVVCYRLTNRDYLKFFNNFMYLSMYYYIDSVSYRLTQSNNSYEIYINSFTDHGNY